MTLKRLVLVLGTSLAAMLAVVMLRAENRRLSYRISLQDARADAATAEIREKELELARLTNPRKIRDQVADTRMKEPPAAARNDKSSTKKRP
jgi:hypothetical protein